MGTVGIAGKLSFKTFVTDGIKVSGLGSCFTATFLSFSCRFFGSVAVEADEHSRSVALDLTSFFGKPLMPPKTFELGRRENNSRQRLQYILKHTNSKPLQSLRICAKSALGPYIQINIVEKIRAKIGELTKGIIVA